jgi:hypothetical protein
MRIRVALTAALAGACMATVGILSSATAFAADQFTLDSGASTFGAVVTDPAGNGYVAWEHGGTGGAPDTPMFCKLPPGATKCAHPVTLSLPNPGDMYGSADQLFPILGPGSVVWVVTSRYVRTDTLIWTSGDGGKTFGPPYVIPYIPSCDSQPPGCVESYSYADKTDGDDMLPVTPAYQTYARQLYLTSGGQPSVYFLESSNNPGLGFNIDNTNETRGGPPGATEFSFSNPGPGGVGGSALGTTKSGDVVEAYWINPDNPQLGYYSFNHPNPNPISPQHGWSAPTILGGGQYPRMADGAAGLFMLSVDSIGSSSSPSAVDIRRWNETTHVFGGPLQLQKNAGLLSGGLGENYDTGEIAAVWAQDSSSRMRLYLSTNGGKKFSPAQNIAAIGSSYGSPILDNARVAIADNGTGFVTFVDQRGLEVADLFPTNSQYGKLHVHKGKAAVTVTCPAPKGKCKIKATLTSKKLGKIASRMLKLAAGKTKTFTLNVSSLAKPVRAKLTIVIRLPGGSSHTITSRPVV